MQGKIKEFPDRVTIRCCEYGSNIVVNKTGETRRIVLHPGTAVTTAETELRVRQANLISDKEVASLEYLKELKDELIAHEDGHNNFIFNNWKSRKMKKEKS